ncbi:MAG: hypothetical protein HC889_11555 [Synechococcaceae cyanobacterium SM1_2_3]|nr:hypothetical protein [Synechococcaceae cyanobacterium SM1_2_3]
MQAIEKNLALGHITEREAKALFFLIETVARDYLLSTSGQAQPKSQMTEPQFGTKPCLTRSLGA